MSFILDGLYMGSVDDAFDNVKLKKLGITHILTVNSKPITLETREGFHYKHIYALDLPNQDLLSHFEESNNFIEDGRTAGGVLVHCFAGESRSGTLVLAFVMNKMTLTLQEATDLVKCHRPKLNPNVGFLKQLELFQMMGARLDPLHKKYKAYKLENLASQMQSGEVALLDDSLTSDPNISQASEITYKCRKCRRALFRKSCIMPHHEGSGEESFRRPWLLSHRSDEVECTQSLFVEPIEWMRNQILSIEGKISCPKCTAKLGSFNWSGERCPCGTWVTPAFHIAVTKVDECKPRVIPTTAHMQKSQPSGHPNQVPSLQLDTSQFPETIGKSQLNDTMS